MRAVGLNADAVLVTSRIWQTTATALRAGGETLLVDSPYLPDELELLPSLLAQAGFEPAGLLATHADFDHLLGRIAYPGLALGLAEDSAARLRAEPGAAQRELRDSDAELYVERERPLQLGAYQALPVPGKLSLGDDELELHPAAGHTPDGMAILWPQRRLLLAGDYLSNVEIPTVYDLDDYRSTLAALSQLLSRVDTVVPGHGAPQPRESALRLLDEDVDYLDALEAGEARLPAGRDTPRQRRIHEDNLRAAHTPPSRGPHAGPGRRPHAAGGTAT